MSIISQIERIGANVSEAIDLLKGKGASLSSENSDSLVEGIDSILGVPIEVAFVSTMDDILANATEADVGKVYRYSGDPTDIYENGAIYIIEEGQTDETPFTFRKFSAGGGIIDVSELPIGGTPVIGTWADTSGTTFPTEVEVENIYFNISLSTSEVVGIMSELTYIRTTDGLDYLISAVGYNIKTQSYVHVTFLRAAGIYCILLKNGDNDPEYVFATGSGAVDELGFDGWNPSFSGILAIDGALGIPGAIVDNDHNIDRQQRQYSTLMSLDPNFTPENVDENAVYRLTEFVNCKVYCRYGEQPLEYYTIKDLVTLKGYPDCILAYSKVDELPEQPDISILNAGFEYIHIYICDDIPKVYGDIGNGNEWITVVDALAHHEFNTTYVGFTSAIAEETTVGLYCTYVETVSLCYYKDGKWHGGAWNGGALDGIIDVSRLPVPGVDLINENVIYRLNTVSATYYFVTDKSVSDFEMFLRALHIDVDVEYHVVDTLPEDMMASILEGVAPVVHCYVLRSTGDVYAICSGLEEGAPTNLTEVFNAEHIGWVYEMPTPVPSGSEGYSCVYCQPTTEYYVYEDGEFRELVPQEAEINPLKFELNSDGTGYVVSCNDIDATGKIIVPATYNNLPVVEVAKDGFAFSRALSIVLQDGMLTINSGAFQIMPRLTELVLPDSITYIADKATSSGGMFGSYLTCQHLRLPSGITHTPTFLMGHSKILTLVVPAEVTDVDFRYDPIDTNPGTIDRLIFEGTPTTISVLDKFYYSEMPNVAEIYAPWSKGDFPEFDAAFEHKKSKIHYNCQNGDTLIAGSNFTNYATVVGFASSIGLTGVTNTAIKSIKIASFVTSIEESAFDGCSSLMSVEIPESVLMIKARAFSGCSALKSVVIPSQVSAINEGTFSDCSALASVTIPEGVTSIGAYAFYCCAALPSVTIPATVTGIGNNAFEDCSALKAITYAGTKEGWKAISFGESWDVNTLDYVVTCTDGTIKKDGTET